MDADRRTGRAVGNGGDLVATAATPPPRLATELALLCVLAGLWGSSYLLIKVAVATMPPLTLIALRWNSRQPLAENRSTSRGHCILPRCRSAPPSCWGWPARASPC